jgi:hypothetical protein
MYWAGTKAYALFAPVFLTGGSPDNLVKFTGAMCCYTGRFVERKNIRISRENRGTGPLRKLQRSVAYLYMPDWGGRLVSVPWRDGHHITPGNPAVIGTPFPVNAHVPHAYRPGERSRRHIPKCFSQKLVYTALIIIRCNSQ